MRSRATANSPAKCRCANIGAEYGTYKPYLTGLGVDTAHIQSFLNLLTRYSSPKGAWWGIVGKSSDRPRRLRVQRLPPAIAEQSADQTIASEFWLCDAREPEAPRQAFGLAAFAIGP